MSKVYLHEMFSPTKRKNNIQQSFHFAREPENLQRRNLVPRVSRWDTFTKKITKT